MVTFKAGKLFRVSNNYLDYSFISKDNFLVFTATRLRSTHSVAGFGLPLLGLARTLVLKGTAFTYATDAFGNRRVTSGTVTEAAWLTPELGTIFSIASGAGISAPSFFKNTNAIFAGKDVIIGGPFGDRLYGFAGSDRISGLGGDDTLRGGSGNDTLIGGSGDDLLTGGLDRDRFLFDSNAAFKSASLGVDQITDFVPGTDKIVLDKTTFTVLSSATSLSGNFVRVTSDMAAATRTAPIVYNSTNGKLFYNPNGAKAGFGSGGQFATLTNTSPLSASDFLLQA